MAGFAVERVLDRPSGWEDRLGAWLACNCHCTSAASTSKRGPGARRRSARERGLVEIVAGGIKLELDSCVVRPRHQISTMVAKPHLETASC